MKNVFLVLLTTFLFVGQSPVFADSSQEVGNFVVHYNALSTESLPPKVAQAYGIKRSKNRGLLNISVLKKGGAFEGVEANIDVSATNLTGQLRNINLRHIQEKNAVYYIADFSVADKETLDFSIKVTTPDQKTANLKLRHQFFAN